MCYEARPEVETEAFISAIGERSEDLLGGLSEIVLDKITLLHLDIAAEVQSVQNNGLGSC